MSLVKKQMVVLLCFLLFVASLIFANKYIKALQGPLSPAHAEAFAAYKKNFSSLLALPGVQAGENNIKLTVNRSKGAFGLAVITSFQDPGKYLTIPAQYSKPMRVQKDGYWVEFTPAFSQKINNVTAEVLKSTIIYPGILPDVDIVQHVMPYGIKEDIVIKGKDAPTFYQWKMVMDPRLTARIEHNYVSFYKKSSSLPEETASASAGVNNWETKMFEIAPPFLMDTKGNKYFQAYTALTNNIYTLSIEKKWLEKLNSFPLVLDPTILHNSSANFATGTHNRSWDEGSGAAPLLTTSYHELAADINTVGLWHMNEASGNAVDSSGNGNTGTPTGTTVVSGKLGNGRSFNGSGHYISPSASSNFNFGTGDYTIESWMKVSLFVAGQGAIWGIFDGASCAGSCAYWIYDTGGIGFGFSNGGSYRGDMSPYINLSEWNHVTVVRSGSGTNNTSIYINGVLRTSWTYAGAVGSSTSPFVIGRNGASGGYYFTGNIDEVRISNIARTPEEIKQDSQRFPYSVYTSPVVDLTQVASWTDLTWLAKGVRTGDGETPISTTGLVAQWNFNETSGVTATNAVSAPAPLATGGTITTSGGYTIHTFTSGGTFTPNGAMNVEYLVVGGGGSGGGIGGGGAGGFRTATGFAVTAQAYTITVGAGGAGTTTATGNKGFDSVFSTITATGGGLGGGETAAAGTGGSGGGGPGNGAGGAASPVGQGNTGGSGVNNGAGTAFAGGGGGGSGAVGSNGSGTSTAGNGGTGTASSISGTSVTYSGGGGGGAYIYTSTGTAATGGSGGGGNGGRNGLNSTSGAANTGGGGGGNGLNSAGNLQGTSGAGASGIVIVRYPSSPGGCGSACNGTLTNFASTASQDQAAGTGWTSANRRWGAGALMFDGSDDVVNVGNNASLNPGQNFTISAWIKPTSFNDSPSFERHIISKTVSDAAPYDAYNIRYSGPYPTYQNLTFQVASSVSGWATVTLPAATVTPLGQWSYVAGVADSANNILRLYVNGVLVASTSTSFTVQTTTNPTIIGASRNTSGTYLNPFKGSIDNVQIFSRALTAAEILANYQAGNIEFQTRTSADNSTWEAWKPVTGETVITAMDADSANWNPIGTQTNPGASCSDIKMKNKSTTDGNYWIQPTGTASPFQVICDMTSYGGGWTLVLNHPLTTGISATSGWVSGNQVGATADFINTALKWKLSDAMINTMKSYGYKGTGSFANCISGACSGSLTFYWKGACNLNMTAGATGACAQTYSDYSFQYSLGTTDAGSTHRGLCANVYASSKYGGCVGHEGDYLWTGPLTADSRHAYTGRTGEQSGWQLWVKDQVADRLVTRSDDSTTKAEGAGSMKVQIGAPQADQNTVALWHLDETSGTGAYIKDVSVAVGGSSTLGDGSSNPGKSCTDIINGRGSASDGIYWIKPPGASSSFQIYCDMTTDGGGWTLIYKTNQSNSNDRTEDGYNTVALTSSTVDGVAVLSKNTISNLGKEFRIFSTDGKKLYWTGYPFYMTDAHPNGSYTAYTKTSWAAAYNVGTYQQNGSHGPCIANNGSFANEHTCIQRWCCGSPNAGIWFNGGPWSGNVYAGTAWVRDRTPINGTPTGTTVVDGFYGKGRSFSTTSDYIDFGSPVSLQIPTFTIETWLKRSVMGNNDHVLGYGPNGWILNMASSNRISLSKYGVSECLSNGTISDTTKWHYLAVTYNGSTCQFYIDGVLDASPAYAVSFSYTTTFRIGYIGATMRGIMDEVRISNIVRTPEEIAEAYRAGRDHRVSKTISSTDFSAKTKLPFYVASDRPGTFMEATFGESPFANYEPDANTTGLYHFDEQSGIANTYIKDSSGNGYNSTTINGTTVVQGKMGKARNFNGTGDYIQFGSKVVPIGVKTIEAWIRGTKTTGMVITDNIGGSSASNGDAFQTSSNKIYWANYSSGGVTRFIVAGNTVINDGNWHHLVGTWDGTTSAGAVKVYTDGKLDNTGTAASTETTTQTYNLRLGGDNVGSGYWFQDNMDEVRFSNVVRTPDEIRQAYEYGRRTHPITIDFVTSPQAAYASGTSVTINNPYGTTALTSTLAVGDTIIFKENVGGTETVSQATVTSVTNTSTTYGTVVLASAPTFPSGGFSTNAKVFKWQREYMDITGSLSTHRDAITRLTMRVTDGSQGANVWLDDFRSNVGYLSSLSPLSYDTATGIGTYTVAGGSIASTLNTYFQYRALNSSWDTAVAPSLTSVALNYVSNTTPGTPTISAPASGDTGVAIAPVITLSATDTQSDYLRYKIQIATDNGFTTGLQTFDQTASQTGWSGQNAQTSTAYNSGSTATYTVQANLPYNQLYYIRAYGIDPGGSNAWSTPSTTGTFTTTPIPAPTNCQISATNVDGPAIVTWTDNLNIEDNYYIESSLNGGAWSAPTTLAANTITSSQTVATGTYQFRIRASSGGVYTSYCTTSSVVFPLESMRFEGVRLEGVQIK